MNSIPNSTTDATETLLEWIPESVIRDLPSAQFAKIWIAIAYLNPGLHPDEQGTPDGGWSPGLARFAKEADRRADAGELPDAVLYASDAAWAAIFDAHRVHSPHEMTRRAYLADHGIDV